MGNTIMGNAMRAVVFAPDDLRRLPVGIHKATRAYVGYKWLKRCRIAGINGAMGHGIAVVEIPKGAVIVVARDLTGMSKSSNVRASTMRAIAIRADGMLCGYGNSPWWAHEWEVGREYKEENLDLDIEITHGRGFHCFTTWSRAKWIMGQCTP